MTRILITGAAGEVGRVLLQELSGKGLDVLATDLHPPADLPDGIRFERMDVRGDNVARIVAAEKPEVIVHLASIVGPMARDRAYEVDVTGSKNIINAALTQGVRRLVVTSSGAAYGYHADNPVPLRETDPVRGNVEFAYSDHKRQVEEMLAPLRESNPELEQVVLRVGTVLGAGLENQITALFHKPKMLAIKGSESPFVFIWTRDLARILARAATDGPTGIFNVAGDGALGVSELAERLGKPVMRLSPSLIKLALGIAKPLGLSRYGPEQVRFLQYRPVLDNTALKEVFGYTPEKTSAEVFEFWRKDAGL